MASTHNCIICATEISEEELNQVGNHLNFSTFKICPHCLATSDPAEDYMEVKKIIVSYMEIQQKYLIKKLGVLSGEK